MGGEAYGRAPVGTGPFVFKFCNEFRRGIHSVHAVIDQGHIVIGSMRLSP